MNSVNVFVKSLVSLTFLWCIAETLLPENSIKKFSSYIYGLIIVSMTVSVFASIDYDKIYIDYSGTDTTQYNKNYLVDLYEKKVEEELKKKFGDSSINVELTEDYKIKRISCNNKETYDDIMRYIYE